MVRADAITNCPISPVKHSASAVPTLAEFFPGGNNSQLSHTGQSFASIAGIRSKNEYKPSAVSFLRCHFFPAPLLKGVLTKF
jgi:hypothetical protein